MTLDNNKAHELFNAARNLPSAEREPFLDKECAENDSLRGEVEALLEYHFTSAQTVQPNEQSSDTTLDYQRGDMIGSFKILNVLGEGGMGIVYLAEQSKPVKRRVALKVIKAGMDTKQVIARFEAERQALAIMNHPGIAQVYEAGVTEHGRPYFVMEHVKGMPITDACDELKLTTKQRLELMAKVCDAVQHAHSKMIIHRDLKPNNVLVSLDDEKLEPKIIDFGVAKAITYQLTEKTLVTQVGHFVGTPAYMSPEQADLKAIDIDAKTDVYALGVVLYEVLTGMPPFDSQALLDAGLEKMREIIRTQPPPKPSVQLSSISDGDDATKIAQARQTQIAALAGLLRKELEWIPLKALKKQRNERYDSAKSMGDDIRRYLAGEALEAGPDSSLYTFKKTLRKHKGLFIAAAIVLLVLVGGIITTTAESIRANKQAAIAEQQRVKAEEAKTALEVVNTQLAHANTNLESKNVELDNQRRIAFQQAYYGNIHAAFAAINQDDPASTRRRLDAARDVATVLKLDDLPFEWKYLHAKNDDSLAVLKGHERGVISVAFSPDGSRIVSAGEYTNRLWDAATGEELAVVLEGHEFNVIFGEFSPDGSRFVSVSWNNAVRVWDAVTGEQLAVLQGMGQGSFVHSVAFSPDGSRIVSADDDGTVRIWDAATIISRNSADDDGTVRIWDAATAEEIAVLKGHEDYVISVAFSPDGSQIVSGSYDKTVRLWDATSGEQLAVLNGHEHEVTSVVFSPDGLRIVSGGMDNTVRIWDAASGEELAVLNGHEAAVCTVAFSPDGSRIVSGGDKTVRLWDAVTGEQLAVLKGHESGVRSVAFSPDGSQIVSGSWDSTVRVWDAASGEEPALEGHESRVHSVAFSPDGLRIVSGGRDNTVRIWDAASGEELAVLNGHEAAVYTVAFSPDGSRIVSGSYDKTVRLWDAASGEELAVLKGHESAVHSVAFSPDGSQIVSGGMDNTVRIWDAASGEELAVLNGHEAAVYTVAFSPDGSGIVSGAYDFTVRIWDAASGEELTVLKTNVNMVNSAAFSPDGSGIVSGGDKTVRLWDAVTGEQLAVLKGHESGVSSVAFSPDGSQIVSGSWDSTVRVWDAVSGEELAVLKGHESFVRTVAFSPDGSCIISGGEDNTIRLWNTKSRSMLANERRRSRNRISNLSPIVTKWIDKTEGDSELVLSMLEREVKNRPPEEVITLRNLVLKKLVKLRKIEWISEKIARDWDHASALNSTVWEAVTSNDKYFPTAVYDDVLRGAQRACELSDYEDANILDTLARVYFERGELDEAIQWQQEAVKFAPENKRQIFTDTLESYREAHDETKIED